MSEYLGDGTLIHQQKEALRAITSCRTAKLGGHIDKCDQCGHTAISYNSCRNANCPKCGGLKRLRWMLQRIVELPPVPYFHMVFTVPDLLNSLFIKYPEAMYNLLLGSVWETVREFAKDPKYLGVSSGMISVLHTWGQNLSLHPHVHCIIPAGGLTPQNQWREAKKLATNYLFPVKAVSKVFRGIFTKGLIRLHEKGWICMQHPIDPKNKGLHPLYRNKWVVFSKAPQWWQSPEQLVKYLSHYVNRVAISNDRILNVTDESVLFSYKDYRDGKTKKMPLSTNEFIRRFLMHILPKGFRKVRYYGILSNRKKKTSLLHVACFVSTSVSVIMQKKKIFRKHGKR